MEKSFKYVVLSVHKFWVLQERRAYDVALKLIANNPDWKIK
jgi:hypothetical protein